MYGPLPVASPDKSSNKGRAADTHQQAEVAKEPGEIKSRRLGRLERWLTLARKQAGTMAAQIMAEGQQMSQEEAVSYALANEPADAWRCGPRATLTPRELAVLGLMAEGRSNAAIAAELVVTDGAVEKHINNIFAKLGLAPADRDHRRVLAVLRYLGADGA